MYQIEKYMISKFFRVFLPTWGLLCLLLFAMKWQSMPDFQWPLYFKWQMTRPFLPLLCAMTLPYAIVFAATKWAETLAEHHFFSSIASLGYLKSRFFFVRVAAMMLFGSMSFFLMVYCHPMLHHNSAALLTKSASYLSKFHDDEFSFVRLDRGVNMVFYANKEEDGTKSYFIERESNRGVNYYLINDFKYQVVDDEWVLSFGQGRQLLLGQDFEPRRWVDFSQHEARIGYQKDEGSVQSQSLSQLNLEKKSARHELFLRIGLPTLAFVSAGLSLEQLQSARRKRSWIWLSAMSKAVVFSLLFFVALIGVERLFFSHLAGLGVIILPLVFMWRAYAARI